MSRSSPPSPPPLQSSHSMPTHLDVEPSTKHELPRRSTDNMLIDRVASEPIGQTEKDAATQRMRRSSDVFDLDLVKRRDRKPKASVYMMEQKGRDRVRRAMMNVFLFPLHLQWWRRRVPVSRPYLYRLSLLYLLHGFSVLREFFRRPSETPVEFVELMMPFLLLIVTSILMGQAAATSIAPTRSEDTQPSLKTPPAKPDAELFSESNSQPPSPSGSVQRNLNHRRMRRKSSKLEAASTAESSNVLFDDGEDEDATGSSAESDSSDTPSDSSGDDSDRKRQRKPHVAVRRSSLLGVVNPVSANGFSSPNPHQPGANGASAHYQTGRSSVVSDSNKKNSTKIPIPPTVPSPRNVANPEVPPRPVMATDPSPRNGKKSRFWQRLSKGGTDSSQVQAKYSSDPAIQIVDADTDSEEDDELAKEQRRTNAVNSSLDDDAGAKPSLGRNRLFSHSMEDLLDAVKSVHWSVHGPEKVLLTPSQIRAELERKVFEVKSDDSYRTLAFIGAITIAMLPISFRVWLYGSALYCHCMHIDPLPLIFDLPTHCQTIAYPPSSWLGEIAGIFSKVFGTSLLDVCGVLTSALSTCLLSWILLGHVAGTVETFKRRYLYAKYFSKLTSSRKARRAGIPYFRLHKVDHIKVWLSLRSRRMDLDAETIGPYKASDTVAHFLFMVAIFLVGVVAFRAMQNLSNPTVGGKNGANGSSYVLPTLPDWFLVCWAFVLAVYVQRIMALASKTHERFQNTSVLLTEELNIHMRLLRKPEKKDELTACNQMLKVAGALIKELEGGKNKKGQGGALILDPWLYSIVRVVLLSALGALSSDLFGFRVRLWKI